MAGPVSAAGATQRVRTLFERYADNQDELHDLAQEIRRRVDEGGSELPTVPEEDEEGVVEGRVLYRVHKTRERLRSAEKKRAVLKETGRLACEVCGFDFVETYGERGRGFAECHHTLPLSTGTRTTYLRDLSIVLRELPPDAAQGRPLEHRPTPSRPGGLRSSRSGRPAALRRNRRTSRARSM